MASPLLSWGSPEQVRALTANKTLLSSQLLWDWLHADGDGLDQQVAADSALTVYTQAIQLLALDDGTRTVAVLCMSRLAASWCLLRENSICANKYLLR